MMPDPHADLSQDRWDRLAVLFETIRDHARGYDFPGASVVALESILIRLYLESPVTMAGTGMSMQDHIGHGGVSGN